MCFFQYFITIAPSVPTKVRVPELDLGKRLALAGSFDDKYLRIAHTLRLGRY
jgi:hypothetical protein